MSPDVRYSLAAAVFAALAVGCNKDRGKDAADQVTGAEVPAASAPGDKACCKGLNDCKGKGGCAVAGANECAGHNECKGQGGCNMHCPK
jgi:hypothetical protein